jgi:hypothetical protein
MHKGEYFMIKRITVMLAVVLIIGSTIAVSATREATATGDWSYGANIFSGTYSNYLDWGHNWWSSSVRTPSGTTKSGPVTTTDEWARAKRSYYVFGGNEAFYNFGD